MMIKSFWSWELPQTLKGFTVVVSDVYGATTNIPSFIARGAKELIIVNNENVYEAKKQYKNALIIGENLKLPKNFFDSSNHPCSIEKIDVKDKTILYMSNNGSKVIETAIKKMASQVLTVSFVNIDAVTSLLEKKRNKKIILINVGDVKFKSKKIVEDSICTDILKDILKGEKITWEKHLKKAEGFIRSYYKCEHMDSEIKTLFSLNRYNIVPSCSMMKNGFITVKSLS